MANNYTFKLVSPIINGADSLTKLIDMKNSIFLAGPCPRTDYSDDWRFEAFEILNKLNFTGNVITPTNENYSRMTTEFGLNKIDALRAQTNWERVAMHMASAIVFWIPRSEKNPARTTNIEFGEWYKRDGVYVGWPDGAIHNEYIELKMTEQNKQRYLSLEDMLTAVVNRLEHSNPDRFFTADTHFKQLRTLELSRRPFVNVKDMDLTLLSNWNKRITINDIVYHAGDFIDPDRIAFLPALLDNLNFAELHWTLGNYDRKVGNKIKAIAEKYSRPIHIYDIDTDMCRLTSGNYKYVIVHEPYDWQYPISKDEIVLYGHIHGRSFAKRNGFDLASDYHRYTPLSMSDVDWFANAMQYWDENVMCDIIKVKD